MEDKGELASPKKSFFKKEETRREFLRETGQAGLAVLLAEFTAAGGSLGALFKMLDNALDAAKAQPVAPETQVGAITPPTTPPAASRTDTNKEPPPADPNQEKESENKSSLLEQLLINCTAGEKQQMAAAIKKQIEVWKTKKNIFDDPTKRLNEQLKNSYQWKETVEECARSLEVEHGFTLQDFIPKLLPALIFVESKGKKDAISEEGAYGLCQMFWKTAQSRAAVLGIKLNKETDLFDSWTNIKLSMAYLDQLYELFPDPTLAFWSYYRGMGHVADALSDFTGQEVNLNNREQVRLGTQLTKTQKLNFIKLTNSQEVKKTLKAKGFIRNTSERVEDLPEGETLLYVIKIAAAASLMEDMK